MRLGSPVVLSYLDAGSEPRCGLKDFLTACLLLLLLLLAKTCSSCYTCAMGKCSGAGHYNQIRRSWRRSKYKKLCAWKLQHPHYVHLQLDACVLEIELRPPVPIRDAPAAFERFRGWLIHTVRPTWPNVHPELHSTKASSAHLHDQRWRLWIP